MRFAAEHSQLQSLYMKLAIGCLSFFCIFLVSCRKQVQPPSPPPPIESATIPLASPRPQDAASGGSAAAAINSRDSFRYGTLPELLGSVISPDVLNRLKGAGQSLPDLKDTPIKGAEPIVIGLHEQIQTIVYVKNDTLVAIGYLFPAPVSANDKQLEAGIRSQYVFFKEDQRQALGGDLNTATIAVLRYRHKSKTSLHGVAYSQGGSQILALYDSGAVTYEAMPLASPETIDNEKIRKMKAEVARMESLIEQAKADKRARESKRNAIDTQPNQ